MNVAVCPIVAVWLAGCVVMDGAVGELELFEELLGLTTPEQPASERMASVATNNDPNWLTQPDRRTRLSPRGICRGRFGSGHGFRPRIDTRREKVDGAIYNAFRLGLGNDIYI